MDNKKLITMSKRHETQLSQIRRHLMDGKSITALEALKEYSCLRLSAHIHTLRHEEFIPICVDYPEAHEGKPYARYWVERGFLLQNHNSNG